MTEKTVKTSGKTSEPPSRAKVKNGRFLGVPLTTREQVERTTYTKRRGRSGDRHA